MSDLAPRTLAGAASISSARKTAHELVLEELRRGILSGELAVGSRLVQSELALSMEVSTTPVREALRDLAAEGLVRIDPHVGAVVQGLSPAEFDEIYEVRMMIEPMAVRRATSSVTPELLERLERIHQMMQQETDPGTWVQLNRDFHLSYYEAGVSSRLSAIIRSLQDASMMYIGVALRQTGLISEANTGHGVIIESLRARDPDRAAEATLQHLQSSKKAFESFLN